MDGHALPIEAKIVCPCPALPAKRGFSFAWRSASPGPLALSGALRPGGQPPAATAVKHLARCTKSGKMVLRLGKQMQAGEPP